ncbi:MAG: hypothetical protein F6J90_42040 [Moorea sp. SIOASIH]|uniref:hormogonium polysaccharide biosynthesis protein HpsJ n=1 Tax=Moorena sp. SIOASIH TaxID=2607817 RepID=UPI0013B8E686|nr:HpsJ family protein [Moorena sp. SIOASIH]NEO42551.1 hypothetical protein [Moorena sp. SIOASIH]NEO95593.1 hypothetical protein [Moorena sp. SIO3G5]
MNTNSVYSSFTALTLKVVGLIMIVSSLLDYIILAIPPQGASLLKPEWQLNFATQVVDRGIIPMVGIGFLFAGYWIAQSAATASTEPKSSVQDLRFWVLCLSSFLGLVFLLMVPLHLNNLRLQSSQALEQINQRAKTAEVQLENRTQQVTELLKSPQGIAQVEKRLADLDAAIKSGRIPAQQLDQAKAQANRVRQQLQAIKENPDLLNQEVEQNINQIRSQKLQLEKRATTEAFKLGIKTGLSSLLLAIGYIAIGWTGLRGLGSTPVTRRGQA